MARAETTRLEVITEFLGAHTRPRPTGKRLCLTRNRGLNEPD
jgi:hypothetical protein